MTGCSVTRSLSVHASLVTALCEATLTTSRVLGPSLTREGQANSASNNAAEGPGLGIWLTYVNCCRCRYG
jgi:hypothetical protein